MTAPLREEIRAARDRENAAFAELMGGPANLEALTAFAEGREPDFTGCRPVGEPGCESRTAIVIRASDETNSHRQCETDEDL